MTSDPSSPPLPLDDPSDDGDGTSFTVSEDLVQSPQHKSAGASNVDELNFLLPVPLRLHEDLKEGCGGQLWPAGIVLAKYIIRQDLKDCSILELGAGGGLVGLAVALAHNRPVHITDQQPMLELMRTNIRLNDLQNKVQASVYDWGSAVPEDSSPPDILLAADCVYFEPAFPLLQKTMQDLIGEKTVCYFCFKRRRRADLNFIKTARKLFTIQDVDDPDSQHYSRQNIFLYRITKKTH